MNNGIIILDFGSQYNQLIGRRIREMGVYSEILPFNTPLETILEKQPKGIILSGGPSSVNAENAHLIQKELYEQGIPVLGICYGMQLTAHLLGGKVHKGVKGEYGKAHLEIVKESSLLKGVTNNSIVWMSHFDEVGQLPAGFELNAQSGVIASISNEDKKIYCVQFHPEVSHTEEGVFTDKRTYQLVKDFIENNKVQKIGDEYVVYKDSDSLRQFDFELALMSRICQNKGL